MSWERERIRFQEEMDARLILQVCLTVTRHDRCRLAMKRMKPGDPISGPIQMFSPGYGQVFVLSPALHVRSGEPGQYTHTFHEAADITLVMN